MKKEIKFSLVFRDMWQSAGKYVPRVDQLVKVAPAIIEMGCFARVETNGGGFEQVNLLFGENPNKAVREWTKPFHEAGIQTHMLDRALNGLRMSPVPADVRKLFYKVKKAQGTDITRTFCGLNDIRNIAPSITYAHEAGMISQCSLCITHSPIHTVEYYTDMALKLIELGADEICIKDMAGIGRPVSLGKIVANIKAAHPEIPVQYHSHAGPGFNMASILEVCEAGCDYIDVGMEPLSWGTGHADLLSVQAMLKEVGINLSVESYDFATAIPILMANGTDISIFGTGGGTYLDSQVLDTIGQNSTNGGARVSDPEFNEHIEAARVAKDEQTRQAEYDAVQQWAFDNYRTLPIGYAQAVVLYHNNIGNVTGLNARSIDIVAVTVA